MWRRYGSVRSVYVKVVHGGHPMAEESERLQRCSASITGGSGGGSVRNFFEMMLENDHDRESNRWPMADLWKIVKD